MRTILEVAWNTYLGFKGGGMHLGLYFAAVLFLVILSKTDNEKKNSYLLSGYSILFWGIFFFPLTAKIIVEYCIDSSVYWRMFWILPFPLIIAYAFAVALKQLPSGWKRGVLVFFMVSIIMVTGSPIYPQNFSRAENIYKIPQNAVDVCQVINEDAKENHIEERKVIVPNELLSYIRQYDGSIQMPYGRNALKNERLQNRNVKQIYQLMSNPDPDFKKLAGYAKREKCNYLVYPIQEMADKKLQELGYERIGEEDAYYVYRRYYE